MMTRLRPLDCFQIITTVLFLVLGAAILMRAAALQITSVLAYVVGAGFAALGLYRAHSILRFLHGKGAGR
jgi:hypothetical protein